MKVTTPHRCIKWRNESNRHYTWRRPSHDYCKHTCDHTLQPASKSRSFRPIKDSQYITFGAIADTNTTIASITPGATASSGLAVSYESNDTSIVSVSGSTLTIQGGGDVTITARQAGNYAYRAAPPEARSFNVLLVGRPITMIFDGGGTMGTNESFKARIALKDGTTGKLIDRSKYTTLSIAYTITNSVTGSTNASVSSSGGINTGSGSGSFTIAAAVTDANSNTQKRYVPSSASITITVDSNKDGQSIFVYDGGSGGFGLRDLPLSRKPIAIGKMFKASSDLDLSYTLSDGSPFEVIGTGAKKALAFKKGAQGVSKGDFDANGEIEVTITASQAGNGSYHAAQSVTRTFKIKKPSKSVFYDERKADPRFDDVKNDALSRIAARKVYPGKKHSPCLTVITTTPMAMVYPTSLNGPLEETPSATIPETIDRPL